MASPPVNGRQQLGTPVSSGPRTWVQTEKKAHEAWSRLTMRSPRAAAIMHRLVALMGHQNAVVVSQKTLAKLIGCGERTVRRALDDLIADRWIQRVQVGERGTINAYVVNAAVAWAEKRDHKTRLAVFNAQIIASEDEQGAAVNLDEQPPLRRLPVIYPPEEAMPTGDGEPGAQTTLPGLEPVIEGPPRPHDPFDE